MKKRLLLISATIMLLCGWFSAFMLNGVVQQNSWNIIGPTLLLGIGMGIIRKNSCWKKTALVVFFTALIALLLMNQFFPERRVTVSAVKQRFKSGQAGKQVTVSVKQADKINAFEQTRTLEIFAPVNIKLFAQLPGSVHMLTTDLTGNIYATIPSLGAIYCLNDSDGDGFADESILYHVGMDRPHGIVWHDGKIYVAEPTRLLELVDTDNDNLADLERVVIDDLPDDGGHWKRSIAVGSDGYIYMAIGSRCNVCEETDQQLATIIKINPTTGDSATFATGLRNAIGLAIAPDSKTLWGTDIGRSGLGNQLPPDEINQITAGGDYGWPYCYGQKIVDPLLGLKDRCDSTSASSFDLPAHSTPGGIAFGDRLNASAKYRNSLYVAMHGSTDESTSTVGRLIRIPYEQQKLSSNGKTFIQGWQVGEQVWGSPTAVIVGNDGNLYLSDDQAQAIYQISWQPTE